MERSGGGGQIAAKRAKPPDGGGQISAKRAKPPDGGEDRLSALHDDLLLRILVLLDTTEAARTSVLACRWRSLWRDAPEVRFNPAPDGNRIRDALDARDDATSSLRRISVTAKDAASDSVAAWLPSAARHLVGDLIYRVVGPKSSVNEEDEEDEDEEDEEEVVKEAGERGVVELPCFEKASKMQLKLRYQRLAFPLQGVFNKLTSLLLSRVRFHGPGDLGNAVSEPHSPCLQKLCVLESRGLHNLSIHSKSLLKIKLFNLGRSLRQLTIVAPNLKKLGMAYCLFDNAHRKPVANISAPQMVSLAWVDAYDPQTVHLGNLGQVQLLRTKIFWVYGSQVQREQNQCLKFLQQFKVPRSLNLILINQPDLDGYQCLLGDITLPPQIMYMHLDILNDGHAFGATLFKVLRMCSGLRRLSFEFYTNSDLEETIERSRTKCTKFIQGQIVCYSGKKIRIHLCYTVCH
ncbi:putative F-box/FBD/LRR-repeat protein At4g03220 isoform X2 [Sorghum bicolor]|uniref:putative F-box/FBD/LRR-repeat protein At4g03220 isoform X2 n=1 Tax=Sorghum bicolor TaxID=4558 RepID=UPI000B42394B|nr:putative F-box/FBD/LRR-repeat protein At4g03220 isoform X2 [Sorghum bicolor]|eukprot:XP_021310575.1 putative F-box/FBD/LRR-repeat protein At4g03220 isoform X2 [Sorghum bicolor]